MKLWQTILSVIFILSVVSMLWIYWFAGFEEVSLYKKPVSSNFSFNVHDSKNMQFYENLRYPETKISYRIDDKCTLQKKSDMEGAINILDEKTILKFYPVFADEEIFISCGNKPIMQGDLFIAGEGGPVNITKSGNFNVIFYGEILLIKQSECPAPNIALHELLHVLGFGHSNNPENIMYNITKCEQTLGDDIPDLINELYSVKNYPDLVLEDVYPAIHGRYLDLNMTVKNNGLKKSEETIINVYAGDILLETIDLQSLNIGEGMKLIMKNINLKKTNFNQLRMILESDFEELDKENNEIVFEIK